MATKINLNDDEAWNVESIAQYYDNDDGDYNDDEEGWFGDMAAKAKNLLAGTIGNVTSGIGKVLGVTPSPASTRGIQNKPQLTGSITTPGGKTVPVQVDSGHIREDIQILQNAIQKINSEIKQIAETTTTNGVALTKLSKQVKAGETASKIQNEMIAKLGTSIDKLGKEMANMKSQQQTNMMMSLLLQPQIEKIQFKQQGGSTNTVVTDGTTAYEVATKSADNNLPFLLLAMSGNDEGGGGFMNMGKDPFSTIFMFQLISGGKGIFQP